MTKFIEQRVEVLENEVAELKLIIHELRGKKSIGPSTTNTVEDIIEFEGKQYRKVDREAQVGDVVIFRINDTDLHHSTTNKPYKVTTEYNGHPRFIGDSGSDYSVYTHDHNRRPETTDVYELIESKPLTPNQQRAEVIEKAKEFVEQLIERGKNRHSPKVDKGHTYYRKNFYNVDIHVKNNKVTALVFLTNPNGKRLDNKPDLINRAICSPTDVFNEHIGKAIALGRALGLNVSEFEQAVQPTLAIGQIVYETEDKTYRTIAESGVYSEESMLTSINSRSARELSVIINDTNAIYGED
ncbi:hypothetical protein ABE61_04095 [Lysinibacillus sphaericus]|uniref:hypothetical protein n=1 Tax=Lysinibacillus sphaericus TaxID=1421 RepID=UPI0018CDE15D|nr:hypothetical protein [Lysinibacillus sphaericus]MBG9453283.1 hypothetical protein [Lysinibacillus sphaericus]MBG9477113.1 hypothetical protein [Lysinibacillus sphaericus]MBG9591195.1 hypothetical protein [Lysinibacillus sphaericus]MBG9591986.1 hypothetical protein [Lysinibacillus sphaericus]